MTAARTTKAAMERALDAVQARGRPFTPEGLADRWGCSAETVRQLIRSGRLRGFRVGRMFRILNAAVEEYECGNTELGASTEDSSSHGLKLGGADGVIVLTHSLERRPKQKP